LDDWVGRLGGVRGEKDQRVDGERLVIGEKLLGGNSGTGVAHPQQSMWV
jgi:hypothetical protein